MPGKEMIYGLEVDMGRVITGRNQIAGKYAVEI
jgi:hypothetical protein